jgi:hypothetical protein
VGDNGAIYRYDGAVSWTRVDGKIDENLKGIGFRDFDHGAVAGANGFLATTSDGGESWQPRRTPTRATLNAIAFGPNNLVYAAGNGGTVLRSADGGVTWQHVTAEWQGTPAGGVPIPPPWYLLFNALVTLPLLVKAARSLRRDEDRVETDSVAESLGSDRPLQKGDPDAMNLRSIALAMSRFLRNENTLPPLTIAITGEWGSGKSSLMNLLKADLVDFGFRPVWFNAWHHQKEEHLLASLLQAVRQQAVPRWWRPENFFFRLRLIWIRGWKYRANLMLLILALSLAAGYETSHHRGETLGSLEKGAEAISNGDFATLIGELPEGVKAEPVVILSLLTVLGAAWRGLKAFHMNPASLLASISGSARVGELTKEINFRDRFASEFSDVTTALGPRSMLIFIDDLDRCTPGSVRDVLEAVNFLVSSGDCFVVLGMDRGRVERYVTASFKDVLGEEKDFAARYLDKLVNIEVPVPEPTEEASARLLVPVREEDSARRGAVRRFAVGALRYWPIALAALVAVAGFFSGRMTTEAPPTMPPAVTTAPAPASASPTTTVAPATITHGAAVPHVWIYWPSVLFLIPLAGVGIWLVRRPQELVVRDSPDFIDAMRIWQPMLVTKLHTPRSMKRFMNRLRYLAMRQRPQTEELTLWRQFALWISGKKPEAPEPVANAIPEPALVALATAEVVGDEELGRTKRQRHMERFGHDPFDWEEAYRRTTAGVRAN